MNRKKRLRGRLLLLQMMEKPEETLDILKDLLEARDVPKEYIKREDWLRNLTWAIYYIIEASRTKPESIKPMDLMLYFRVIDYIVASIPEMLTTLKEMLGERTISLYMESKKDPDILRLQVELDNIETILALVDGLRRHIRRILEKC